MASTRREHVELARQIRRLGRLLDGIDVELPRTRTFSNCGDCSMGLYAVVRLHFAQEDEPDRIEVAEGETLVVTDRGRPVDFATIVAAVEHGRATFANIKRFLLRIVGAKALDASDAGRGHESAPDRERGTKKGCTEDVGP